MAIGWVRTVGCAAGVGAAAAYAWWATGLRPFSAALTVAVMGGGAAAMAAGTAARRRTGAAAAAPAATRDVAGWALLFGALTLWELAAYLQHPRSEHPTVSSLADGVLDPHPVRAGVFVVWLAVAAVLARR